MQKSYPNQCYPAELSSFTSMASNVIQLLRHAYYFHSVHSQSKTPLSLSNLHPKHSKQSTLKCSADSSPTSEPDSEESSFPSPSPSSLATTSAEKFPIEKRRRSEIVRERRPGTGLAKPEPPNFEIGWKRTVPINTEQPVGYVVMDFLEKLEGLMGREFGSVELLAKAGEIVAERAREEAEVLRDEGKVEERMVTELSRVLKLMEMDLSMVRAAVKEETLNERLEQARARCRQAILVAKSF